MKINSLSYCSLIVSASVFVFLTSRHTADAFVIVSDGSDTFRQSTPSLSSNGATFSFPDYDPETDVCTLDHSKIISEEDEVSIDVELAMATEGDGLVKVNFLDGQFAGLSGAVGWCVDLGRSISGGNYKFDVFSSLDTTGVIHGDAVDNPQYLPALNWLINEMPTGTVVTIPDCEENHMITDQESQLATWLIVDDADREEVFNNWMNEEHGCVVDWLMATAISNQENNGDYEPDCYNSTGKIGLLLVVDDDENDNEILNQVLIVEIDVRHVCTCVPVTLSPSTSPTASPTKSPTINPTASTGSPTERPTGTPTKQPTNAPTGSPTGMPTKAPTLSPTVSAGVGPTTVGSESPTLSVQPTRQPIDGPTTSSPTSSPTSQPTTSPPTSAPSKYDAGGAKTEEPTENPTKAPTDTSITPQPTGPDTIAPTLQSTGPDTIAPTLQPTAHDAFQGANGDPHFKTWSGERYDYHGICDLVLLSNPKFNDNLGMDIYIRSKKTKQWSYISTAVIRIGIETFEVSGREDGDTYWVNGIEGDDKDDDIMWDEGTNIAGYPITFQRVHSTQRQYVIDIGKNDEKIVFRTWKDFVRVDVINPRDEDFTGSLGLMGSYPDGNNVGRSDPSSLMKDKNDFGQEWQVLFSDPKIFHSVEGPQSPSRCELPSKSALRRRLSTSEISREDAKISCSHINDAEERDLCIFDVMATNDKATANAY